MKKLTLIFSAVFGLGFLSCQKEMHHVDYSTQAIAVELPELVKSAQHYYDQELKETMAFGFNSKLQERLASKGATSTVSASPQEPTVHAFWKRAHTSKYKSKQIVEVPLRFSHRTVSLIKIPRDSLGYTPDRTMIRTIFDRLILSQQKGGNSFRTQIVRYHPDKGFLEKHGNNVQHVHLYELDGFTGYLEYLTTHGERKAVIRVVDGKPVKRYWMGATPPQRKTNRKES